MLELSEIKNYLNVTYDDGAVDEKINSISVRAEMQIRNWVGIDSKKAPTEPEKQLFLDLCRYIFNNAFEDFEQNFSSLITAARALREIEHAEAQNGS